MFSETLKLISAFVAAVYDRRWPASWKQRRRSQTAATVGSSGNTEGCSTPEFRRDSFPSSEAASLAMNLHQLTACGLQPLQHHLAHPLDQAIAQVMVLLA